MKAILSKNLNLLPTLVAIADELNLSRAAEKLRLTQPALSHALNKLRSEFDDPLLVRSSHGFVLTDMGAAVVERARVALQKIEEVYTPQKKDIASIQRTFVIASTTYFEQRIIRKLLRVAEKQAPHVSFDFRPLVAQTPRTELESGEYDIAVAAYFKDLPDGLRTKIVASDTHVCVARRNHPYGTSRNRLKAYLASPHLVIAVPPGVPQNIDVALAQRKLSRRWAVATSNFMTPPLALENSNLILTCPSALAETYCSKNDLEIYPTPLPVPDIEVRMIWHERSHNDFSCQWLRGVLTSS